jgi:Cu(I)/Ag(I) efflux system protein CusF
MSNTSHTKRGVASLVAIILAATCAVAISALATESEPTESEPALGTVLSFGRVVKVDPGAGTITIEHRVIEHLWMEPMTMIFRVSDPAMLALLTPGDKIRFRVERDAGGFVVTKIENSIR